MVGTLFRTLEGGHLEQGGCTRLHRSASQFLISSLSASHYQATQRDHRLLLLLVLFQSRHGAVRFHVIGAEKVHATNLAPFQQFASPTRHIEHVPSRIQGAACASDVKNVDRIQAPQPDALPEVSVRCR